MAEVAMIDAVVAAGVKRFLVTGFGIDLHAVTAMLQAEVQLLQSISATFRAGS